MMPDTAPTFLLTALLCLGTLLPACSPPPEDNSEDNPVVTTPPAQACVDRDGDGYFVSKLGGTDPECGVPDCNDSEAGARPGEQEICGNGIDDDCKGGDEICPAGPACDDAVQNGDETGVDCGGSCAACPEPGGVQSVDIAGRGEQAQLYAGALFDATVTYRSGEACPECTTQLQVFVIDGDSASCLFEGAIAQPGVITQGVVELQAPMMPGSYKLGVMQGFDGSCEDAQQRYRDDAAVREAITPVGALEVIAPDLSPRELMQLSTQRCVDVPMSSTQNTTPLITYACTQAANQLFSFEHGTAGAYTLRAQHSNKCISLAASRKSDGDAVQQFDCNFNQPNQQLQLHAHKGGYTLKFAHSSLCLSAGDALDAGSSALIQSSCEPSQENLFTFQEYDDIAFIANLGFETFDSTELEMSRARSVSSAQTWGLGNVFTVGGRLEGAFAGRTDFNVLDVEFLVGAPTACNYTLFVHQMRSPTDPFSEFRSYPVTVSQAQLGWVGANEGTDFRLHHGKTYMVSIRPDEACYSDEFGDSKVFAQASDLPQEQRRFGMALFERVGAYATYGDDLPDFPGADSVDAFWSEALTARPLLMRMKVEVFANQ